MDLAQNLVMFKSTASILSPTMVSCKKDQSFVEPDDPERSNPDVNSDALPDDHPIHLLPDARKLYSGNRPPPFALVNHPQVTKSVVIPTKDGLRPKNEKATKVKIVARPWNKEFMFWALDLNDIRYIVKAFSGRGPRGWRYLYWAGPDRNFEQKPLALSFVSPSHPGTTISSKGDGTVPGRSMLAPVNRKRSIPAELFDLSDSIDSSDSSDSSHSSNASDSELGGKSVCMSGLPHRVADAGSGKYLQNINDSSSDRADNYTSDTNALKQPSAPTKRRKLEVSSHEIDQLSRVSPPARLRSDVHAPVRKNTPEVAQPTISTSCIPRNERRIQRCMAKIENHLERKIVQIFTPWAGADQDLGRDTLEMIWKAITLMEGDTPQNITRTLNKALNGGDGKSQPAGGKRPSRPYFRGLIAGLQSTRTADSNGGGPNTSSSLSESNHQQPDRRTSQRMEAANAKGTGADQRSILSDGNQPQSDRKLDLDTPPSMVLPQQKQTRTTLFIRMATSPEYLPLKLSECTTSQAFYTKVLGAWRVREESLATMAEGGADGSGGCVCSVCPSERGTGCLERGSDQGVGIVMSAVCWRWEGGRAGR